MGSPFNFGKKIKSYGVLQYLTICKSTGVDVMNQSILSVRLSSEDKKQFEEFCSQTGMNVSVCVNMFVKVVLRDQKLPFEVKSVVKKDKKPD